MGQFSAGPHAYKSRIGAIQDPYCNSLWPDIEAVHPNILKSLYHESIFVNDDALMKKNFKSQVPHTGFQLPKIKSKFEEEAAVYSDRR